MNLAEPLENRVLFAGEATSTDSYGYAHGALMSARREATRLLFVYNLFSEPDSTGSESPANNPEILLIIVAFLFIQLFLK